jgi:hypothetical protein
VRRSPSSVRATDFALPTGSSIHPGLGVESVRGQAENGERCFGEFLFVKSIGKRHWGLSSFGYPKKIPVGSASTSRRRSGPACDRPDRTNDSS